MSAIGRSTKLISICASPRWQPAPPDVITREELRKHRITREWLLDLVDQLADRECSFDERIKAGAEIEPGGEDDYYLRGPDVSRTRYSLESVRQAMTARSAR